MLRSFIKVVRYLIVLSWLSSASVSLGQSFDELMKAVEKGDAKNVASLIDRGLDPNSTDPNGNTILMLASRLGHQELVALLLARKADVARRSPAGDTALMMASLGGDLPIIRLLVVSGAALNQDGWTPLHYAAFAGHGEIARYLIERGANKNAVAPNGYTALMLAARNGQNAAARAILYEDPDLGHKGPQGETALSLAAQKSNAELVELLRRAGAVE